jgi:hypothetical protein
VRDEGGLLDMTRPIDPQQSQENSHKRDMPGL